MHIQVPNITINSNHFSLLCNKQCFRAKSCLKATPCLSPHYTVLSMMALLLVLSVMLRVLSNSMVPVPVHPSNQSLMSPSPSKVRGGSISGRGIASNNLSSAISKETSLLFQSLCNYPNARTHSNYPFVGRQFEIAISCNPLPGIALQGININYASAKIASKVTDMTTQEF